MMTHESQGNFFKGIFLNEFCSLKKFPHRGMTHEAQGSLFLKNFLDELCK
jgi:hypothetical protein